MSSNQFSTCYSVAFILVLGFLGVFRPYDRGFMKTVIIISHAIACGLAGFTSVSFYRQLEGSEWVSFRSF